MQVARPLPSFSRQTQPCLEASPLASCPTPPPIRSLTSSILTAIASPQAGTPRPPFRFLQHPGGAATILPYPGSVRVSCSGLGDRGTGGADGGVGGAGGAAGGRGLGVSTRRWSRRARLRAHRGPCEAVSSDSESDGGGGDVLYGRSGGGLSPLEIISVAEEYVDAWWRGVARGTEAAAESLSRLVAVKPRKEAGWDSELALIPDGVLHRRQLQGYDALLSQLAAQHTEYHRVQYRPVSRAASTVSSCGYVLGEYRMQDVGGLAGHPATFRVSKGFCLFKLRVDPRSGRITRGWVRRQLTQEERDERVWDPVHVYPAPFPLERVHLTRDGKPGARVMEAAACTWVAAQAKHLPHATQPPPPPPPHSASGSTSTPSSQPSSTYASSSASKSRVAPTSDSSVAAARTAATEGEGAGSGKNVSGAPPLAVTTDSGMTAEGTTVMEKDEVAVGAERATTAAAAAGSAECNAVQEPPPPPSEGAATAGGGGISGGFGGIDSISTAGMISSTSPEITSGSGGGGGGGGAESTESSELVRPREAPLATKAQRRLVESVLAADCRLLDAYGMWPDPEDEDGPHTSPAYSGTYGGQRPKAVTGASRVLKRIQAHQKRCERIEPLLYDVAVSEDHNVVFVHWVNLITPAPEPVAPLPPAPVRQQQHQSAPAQQDPAPASSLTTETGLTRRETSGGGSGGSSTSSAAVAASTAASAAATAASAAAQAATAAADVATTAASAASVAANTANTAATIAATAATAAVFVVGDVTVRPNDAAAAVAGSHPPALPDGTAPAAEAPPHTEGGGRSLAVVTSGGAGSPSAGSEKESVVAAAAAGGTPPPAAASGAPAESSGGDFTRLIGLQDLRITMPPMPPIPQMPPMPQIQSQIQNIEEVLTAAAQRVAGAAGTAAAAASAAAAAASAVIKAEAAASGGGAAAAAAITNGASSKDIAAAADAKAMAARKPPAPPPMVPYNQECMAALLINDDGTVSDVWLFRGPYHHEKRLLRP